MELITKTIQAAITAHNTTATFKNSLSKKFGFKPVSRNSDEILLSIIQTEYPNVVDLDAFMLANGFEREPKKIKEDSTADIPW